MREPLVTHVFVIRLTLLALFVSAVALFIPYPQTRLEVVSPQVNATQSREIDSNS